ncbi:MAG: TetR/AcrR family transcriptional regulator [Alphaproteobacteria bacterium]|nr:TetR/AcrR family transcriptional regulator [Alphaproteobacteria bacterium]
MARPDLSAERSEQILDAFSRCVARSGLDAASLEEVAGEAGVRRSIIRHYIGNRDDLVAAFLDRLEARLQLQNDEMRAWFIANPGVGSLPDYLFPEAPDDELPVLESVYSAARRNPDIAARLENWLQGFVNALGDVLRASFPDADPDDVTTVAHGLAAIYNDHQSMLTLRGPPRYRAMALAAAQKLIASLTTRARP